MKSINKLSAKDLKSILNPINVIKTKTFTNLEEDLGKLVKPYVEDIPVELDNTISYDMLKKIETYSDVSDFINNQKAAGIPAWEIIASVAKIAALPKKIVVPFPEDADGPWAAAGKRLDNNWTKEYLAMHDLARLHKIVDGNHNAGDFAYGSCAQAAAAVIIPIYDSELPVDSPKAQYEYLTGKGKENGKWTEVNVDNNGKPIIKEGTSWSDYDLRPGDLVLTEQAADGTEHILIYIGEEGGVPTFYEAEAHANDYSVYPYITRQPFVDDHKDGVKSGGDRQYHVFRPNV